MEEVPAGEVEEVKKLGGNPSVILSSSFYLINDVK